MDLFTSLSRSRGGEVAWFFAKEYGKGVDITCR
jgi:hypothetical protein